MTEPLNPGGKTVTPRAPDHPTVRGVAAADLLVVARPCPQRRWRGAAGGQMFTTCSMCGQLMPSSAGPHPDDGWLMTLCVITGVSREGFAWRRLDRSEFGGRADA
jgi:hypothetical protein